MTKSLFMIDFSIFSLYNIFFLCRLHDLMIVFCSQTTDREMRKSIQKLLKKDQWKSTQKLLENDQCLFQKLKKKKLIGKSNSGSVVKTQPKRTKKLF